MTSWKSLINRSLLERITSYPSTMKSSKSKLLPRMNWVRANQIRIQNQSIPPSIPSIFLISQSPLFLIMYWFSYRNDHLDTKTSLYTCSYQTLRLQAIDSPTPSWRRSPDASRTSPRTAKHSPSRGIHSLQSCVGIKRDQPLSTSFRQGQLWHLR